MDSNTQKGRVSLLETIMSDSALIQRLSEAKSVSLTLTLEIDSSGQARLEHPNLASGEHGADAASGATEGFVPSRPIAGPGERADENTEYRLVGKLGSGGTGIVYQAHQRAIDREVAVKVLRDELACDTLSRRRFLQEARTLGSLDHPNVIALHELGTGPRGELFYSMKRVNGSSWDASIDLMSLSDNLDVLMRVANAIRYAHSRGLIHRDIKPENVMVGPFGEVLVADWGLALSFSGEQQRVFKSNSIGGTPAYMAPELADGDIASQSARTDVYLLGALLYRIVTGHPPHGGSTLLECIQAAAQNIILSTSVQNGWVDVALKAMATKPSDRYGDVAEFMEAMQQQMLHQQSEDLVRRAKRKVAQTQGPITHQDYSIGEALVREALDVWPENREAVVTLTKLQTEHARAAAANGDFDLALALLSDVGLGNSELAARVRRDQQNRRDQAKREAKYSALFTRSPDAGLLTRADDAQIVEANEQFERLTGYAAQDVVDKRIPDMHLWACPERRRLFVEALTQHGHVDDFETPLLRNDGSVLDASLSANRFTMDGQDYVLTTIRDIGARKEAQSQLKRSRQRLRDMQHLAQLGTWELNVKTGEVQWSDETFRIAGRSLEHGSPNMDEYLKTVHPEDRHKLIEAIDGTIRYQTAYEVQLRHRRPDGSFNTVIARGQPYLSESGEVTEIYGIVIDISRHVEEIETLRKHIEGI